MESSTINDEQVEEQAFEAGFNATDIEPVAPLEEKTTPEEPPVEAKQEEETQSEIIPEKRPLTEDDLAAIESKLKGEFGKNFDRVFGKIGEVSQKLTELQNMREQAAKISPKARDRLKVEFPELEEMLFDREEEKETKQEVNQDDERKPEPAKTEDRPDKEVQLTVEQLVERRLLKRDHPDWEQVVHTPDFIGWVNKLPAADKEQLRASWDADYVSQKLSEFKAAKNTAAQTTKNQKAAIDKSKEDRLAAALTPRRVPADLTLDTDDEEAAMLKSFRPYR